jgi:hypothetical protein
MLNSLPLHHLGVSDHLEMMEQLGLVAEPGQQEEGG